MKLDFRDSCDLMHSLGLLAGGRYRPCFKTDRRQCAPNLQDALEHEARWCDRAAEHFRAMGDFEAARWEELRARHCRAKAAEKRGAA